MRPRWSGLARGFRNPVVQGRKFCAHCGRWRHVSDFRDRKGGPDSYCHRCRLAVSRDRYPLTPRERALKREYDRFYRERLRREAGVKPATRAKAWPAGRDPGTPIKNAAPLVQAMADYIEVQRNNGHPSYTWADLAVELRMSDRNLRRVRAPGAILRLALADRIAVAIDTPLSLIYPS